MDIAPQDLQELAKQFGIDIKPLQGELACVFVGEWNAGKSALLNSLFGMPLLPEKPIPTTKTVVSLGHGTDTETTITIQTETGKIENYQGQAATEALQKATENLPRIDYRSNNLDMPANTLFIDTPGFNDTDQIASTKAEMIPADIVIFVINAGISAINQTQINFIQQVVMSKASIKDVFFVATHCDLLEEQEDLDKLHQRIAVHVDSDRIFLLSNKNHQGIQEFKQVLYDYLNQRQADILEQRRQRYYSQLTEALRHQVSIERAALAHYKSQGDEQRKKLWLDIQEARRKETSKKSDLHHRSRQYLQETLYELRQLIDNSEDQLEKFVDNSTVEQLQRKGFIQQKIHDVMETIIQPQVQNKLENLLKSIQGGVEEGQHYSTQLLADLDVHLPNYSSPLASVTGEQILPIAFIGSVLMLGWFSVPTILLGFFAIKAREFGLTRYADQTGLLNSAIDKIKEISAVGYKRALKMTIAKTLTDYTNQIADHFRDVLEKVTEQALTKINLVADLEQAMQKLQNDRDVIDREIRLDKADILLKTL